MSKFIKLGETVINIECISHARIIRYGGMSDTIEIKMANGESLGDAKSNLPKLLGYKDDNPNGLFDELWKFLLEELSPTNFRPKYKDPE